MFTTLCQITKNSSPLMANGTGLFYLRKGIWWANPLGNAELQVFTNFLPKEYRKNRQLSRDALSYLGISDFFVTQKPKEGLLDTVNHLLLHADWVEIFKDSILCELGLIDKAELFKGVEIFKKNQSMNISIKTMLALEIELSLKDFISNDRKAI